MAFKCTEDGSNRDRETQDKEQQRTETRETRRKPASKINRLTELHKQMMLPGNCGQLLETRTAFCHQERGRRMKKGAIKRCGQKLTGMLRSA